MHCVHPAFSQVLTLRDGRTIELLETLGRGSFGTVYRGLVESGWGVRRPVAVKVFSPPPDLEPGDAIRHLARVARRAVSIRHPSFIEILEVDHTDSGDYGSLMSAEGEQPFCVMELVDGESLASLIQSFCRDGIRIPVDFATVVTLRTAEALAAALFSDGVDGALTGLVHGDLSPRQILVSSHGDVKVGDFGLSALRDTCSHVRSRSRLAYTAPEVASGSAPTSRADVFSLGAILHEMLIGPRFASGTSIVDASQMVRDGDFQSNILEPNLPRSLRDVLERAIARHPMARHPHAQALSFELRREMLRLGLCDARTCIRHAVVGFCGTGEGEGGREVEAHLVPPVSVAANDVELPRKPR